MEKLIEIQIKIEYRTSSGPGQNEFKNLQDLKIWLDKHPEMAKALGYNKGSK